MVAIAVLLLSNLKSWITLAYFPLGKLYFHLCRNYLECTTLCIYSLPLFVLLLLNAPIQLFRGCISPLVVFFRKGEVVFCIVEQTNRISKWCVSLGWSANLQLNLADLITFVKFYRHIHFQISDIYYVKANKSRHSEKVSGYFQFIK